MGTPERATERLADYAAGGVQRLTLNHEHVDDLDVLELLAVQLMTSAAPAIGANRERFPADRSGPSATQARFRPS